MSEEERERKREKKEGKRMKGKDNCKTFPRSMAASITMQGIRSLLTDTLDGILEKLTEEISNLAGINTISVIIVISLTIYILPLKWFDNNVKTEKLTGNIQTLEDNMQAFQIVMKEGKTALTDKLKLLEVFTIEDKK